MAGSAAIVKGQFLHQCHHSTQPPGIVSRDVGQRSNVVPGHQQQVRRRRRIDVVEGDEFVVFVNFLGRNLAGRDLAEDTGVTHKFSIQVSGRPAFSTRPETPSRRSNSFRICSGLIP